MHLIMTMGPVVQLTAELTASFFVYMVVVIV